MERKKFDEKRFEILIQAANRTGRYHIEDIGRGISTIADVVLAQACFKDYTEDWLAELRSVAYEYMMDALKNYDPSKGRAFTYLYGIASNACGRRLKKLKRVTLAKELMIEYQNGNDYITRDDNSGVHSQRPFFSIGGVMPVTKRRKENPCNSIKKAVLLRNVVNRAVAEAVEGFPAEQIDNLIELARKNRRHYA